jgi:hypothetical protein
VNIAFVFILTVRRSITYTRYYDILVKTIITKKTINFIYKRICKPFITLLFLIIKVYNIVFLIKLYQIAEVSTMARSFEEFFRLCKMLIWFVPHFYSCSLLSLSSIESNLPVNAISWSGAWCAIASSCHDPSLLGLANLVLRSLYICTSFQVGI